MKFRGVVSVLLVLILGVAKLYIFINDSEEVSVSRELANVGRHKASDQVLVFRKNIKPYVTRAPEPNLFKVRSKNSGLELEKLKKVLLEKRQAFGISNDAEDFELVLRSVKGKKGKRVFVRYNQVQERRVGGSPYRTPVSGGSLVVTLKDDKIDRVNTSLKSIRKKDLSFKNSGFDLSKLSELELDVLSSQIQQSKNKKSIEKYFNQLLMAGASFDVALFLGLTNKDKRKALVEIFGSLNKIGTSRILIELAQAQKLSLVQYGRNKDWMYTVAQPFGLDIEFDIQIPKSDNEKLNIKNLRESSYDSDVNLFISPHFPIEMGKVAIIINKDGMLEKVPEVDSFSIDFITAKNFKSLSQYYENKYEWHGFDGDENDAPSSIDIHTQLQGRYVGSARWSATRDLFLLGANGRGWVDKGKSFSILGHEYFHAIITYSSGLVYRGQPGGINEHLADLQGVLFEADKRHQGRFDYTIGDEGVFTTQMEQELIDANLDWAKKNKMSSARVAKYNVGEANLRNLYYPEASKHRQYSDYNEMLKEFPEDCEPTVANDKCGVHFSSGVLNKALSRIIETLGIEKMRTVIFNTAVYRLNSDSNFKEYGLQLYEECHEQSDIAENENALTQDNCEVIVRSFKQVGIELESSQVVNFQ